MPAGEPDPRLILDTLPHPVIVLGPKDAIAGANTAAEVFFGLGRDVLMRRRLEDLIPPGHPLHTLVATARREWLTVTEYALPLSFVHARPPEEAADVRVLPLGEAEDAQLMVLLQADAMQRRLGDHTHHKGAARGITSLAGLLAHEIKNPLSGIRGAAQLLEENLGEDDRALSRLIVDEVERIRKLIDRMEIFTDTRPIERAAVNIHDVLNRVRHIAQSGFAAHARFMESYDPSLPPVSGDRDLLIQALLNLVKNAAEAIPREGGVIRLATAYRSGVVHTDPATGARHRLPVEVTVGDNGPGIDPDLRDRLFDPFVTTKRQGMGLGLALVAKVVADHGGLVECESRPGDTRLLLLLPRHDDAAEGETP
jgi:two-component system nitrogen regulation sensor histidine kinase GlnL